MDFNINETKANESNFDLYSNIFNVQTELIVINFTIKFLI